jgi:hypothetical protein
MHHHGAWLQLDVFSLAGEIIGPLAIDLDRGVDRRRLLNLANETLQCFFDRFTRRAYVGLAGHGALAVLGGGRRSPADREHVILVRLHDVADRLGGLAKRQGQDARRQRVQRAAMSCLLRVEHTPADADGLRRGHALGLVEHQPAVNRLALFLAGHRVSPGAAEGSNPGRVVGCIDQGDMHRVAGIRRDVQAGQLGGAPHRSRRQRAVAPNR